MSARVEGPPTFAALLEEQAAAASNEPSRHALLRRSVVVHLEAGGADDASRVLESMVWDGVLVWELVDLFEQVAARPGQDSARDRLMRHYDCVGSVEGGARVRKLAVDVASNPRERVRCVRELVRFRLSHLPASRRPLTALLTELAADLAARGDALAIAYRATLVRAFPIWRAAATDAAFEDALEAAWGAVDGLSKIHLRRGDVARAARLLKRGAQLRFEHARRRLLLHRAALLYAERLHDDATAVRLFKQIFDDDDGDGIARSSFDQFRALLAAGGHVAKLAWLFERRGRRSARSGDAAGACADLERAGMLWERAADEARACDAYALASTLGSERSLEALARIHTARRTWKDAAAALDQLAARSAAARRRYGVRLAEAKVALGEHDSARSVIEDVLRGAPDAAETAAARALLLRIHRETGAFRSVAELLEEGARAARGPRAAALLCEAAEVYRTALGDPGEAMRRLKLARQMDPSNPSVHPALAEALASLGMWDALLEVLAEHVSLHGHRRGAALLGIRMRLVEALVELGRVDDALEQVHFAVRLDPSDPALLHARARLERATGDPDAAERTLRAALVATKSPREPGDIRRRIQICVDLSSLAIERGDRERALALVTPALELAFEHGEDPSATEDVLRELGEQGLLARALEARCTRASDAMSRLSALEALVECWRASALPARLGSLVGLVARAVASDAIARTREATWKRLLAMGTLVEDEELRFAIAKLRVDAAGEDEPSRAQASVALARMLEGAGRFDEAASVFARCAGSGDRDVAWQLGRVLESAGRPREAGVVYASILDAPDRGPADLDALRTLAARLEAVGSERLADCVERLTALDPDSAEPLVRRLVELRAAQGDEAGLSRALQKAVRVAPHDRALLWRLVEAHRRAGSDAESLGPIDAALRLAPHDVELLVLRARLRERIGDVDGALDDVRTAGACDSHSHCAALAVPVLRRILGRAEDGAANEHAITAADLLCRFGLAAEAEGALELVLARDPGAIGALQRLASSAVVREEWERAADLYGRLVGLLELPEHDPAFGGLLVAFADACHRAGRPSDAREALELALARRPEGVAVAWQLERTCEATGAWHRLSELLAARAYRMADPAKRERLLLRAAKVLAEEAGAHAEALSLLGLVCAEFPASVEASLACAGALIALARPGEALALLEPALQRAGDASAALRAEILLETGKAYLSLEEPLEAFAKLEAGLDLHTRNRELAMLLGVVAHDLGDEETAERALRIAMDLSSGDDGGRADLAAVDARVAARILSSIGQTRDARQSSAPRTASGIEVRRGAAKAWPQDSALTSSRRQRRLRRRG